RAPPPCAAAHARRPRRDARDALRSPPPAVAAAPDAAPRAAARRARRRSSRRRPRALRCPARRAARRSRRPGRRYRSARRCRRQRPPSRTTPAAAAQDPARGPCPPGRPASRARGHPGWRRGGGRRRCRRPRTPPGHRPAPASPRQRARAGGQRGASAGHGRTRRAWRRDRVRRRLPAAARAGKKELQPRVRTGSSDPSPAGKGPSMHAGSRSKADAPALGEAAVDNHLPVDAQVPAGLGTFPRLPRAAPGEAAPASKGLSLRRSRWMGGSCQPSGTMSISSFGLKDGYEAPVPVPERGPLVHNPPMPILRPLAALLCGALLVACATSPEPVRTSASPVLGEARPSVEVAESFVTEPSRGDELDSLATWTSEDGRVLVIATAKSSHRLVVYDGDSGERLREVGGKGTGPGRFTRPNGVLVFGDLVFVTERDARRVQVLSLPGFDPVGSFGEDVLRSPYALWLHETAPGELHAYVTDSFMYGDDYTVVPAWEELDQRVRRFRVRRDATGGIDARYQGSFGDTSQAAGLRMVESI